MQPGSLLASHHLRADTSSAYGQCLRHVVLPVADWMRGVPIGRTLDHLHETQWWSWADLAALQERKLCDLVRAATAMFPAYARHLARDGVDVGMVRSLADLPKLPLVTKDLIRETRAASERLARSHSWLTVRTGGSTGQPLFFYQSRACRAWDRASYYRCLQWCGSDRGEVLFAVWGDPVVMRSSSRMARRMQLRWVTRQRGLDAFRMTPDRMQEFVAAMQASRPQVLRGYASALVELGEFVSSHKLTVPSLRALTTTAEQLLPLQRRLIEQAFDAPVFDQYGSAEVGGAAYECDRHAGLHVAAEHCIVEVVDDEGQPVPSGTVGRLAITNLDNEATPFIRYVNGDLGVLDDGPCSCGRTLPRLASIEGRTCDVIRGLNGNRAHGEFFTHLLHELGWTESLRLRAFQAVQTSPRRLELLVVAAVQPSEADVSVMVRRIRDYLGPMAVDVRRVDEIERSGSGKFRFTIRKDTAPA